MFSVDQLVDIVAEAKAEAQIAALAAEDRIAGGFTGCGFAWVNIYQFEGKKIRGNTKLGKNMKAAGIDQDYTKAYQIWNPSELPTQDITVKEEGARAAAEVFKKYGFTAYAGSRLD